MEVNWKPAFESNPLPRNWLRSKIPSAYPDPLDALFVNNTLLRVRSNSLS